MEESFKSALLKDDDLASVIRVHLHIEHHVNEILELLTPTPKHIDSLNLEYEGKVNLIAALGVHPKSIKVLKSLGRLRNKFAHNLNFKLDKSSVKNLYETLDAYEKNLLFNAQEMTRNFVDNKESSPYKELPPKHQFILIAIVVKNMVERLSSEIKSSI